MKTPLKLNHMETGEIIMMGVTSLGAISLAGLTAVIKQVVTNTSIKARIKAVEDEHKDIHEIRKSVTEIQIINSKYFTILEANQKTLEILSTSVSLIHQRIDSISDSN